VQKKIMSDTLKTTVYLKKDIKKLFDNVSFLLKEQKGDLINEALEIHLKKLIKDKNLEDKLKALED
jgi:hypothetical protein